mmetsp:Transcript_25601/g.81464  ORF Transcript_25601/g.81464 Transcript_25601/m.81464 type:complete len:211 (-) Transcript_25601:1306-1938(-)
MEWGERRVACATEIAKVAALLGVVLDKGVPLRALGAQVHRERRTLKVGVKLDKLADHGKISVLARDEERCQAGSKAQVDVAAIFLEQHHELGRCIPVHAQKHRIQPVMVNGVDLTPILEKQARDLDIPAILATGAVQGCPAFALLEVQVGSASFDNHGCNSVKVMQGGEVEGREPVNVLYVEVGTGLNKHLGDRFVPPPRSDGFHECSPA